MLYSFYGIGSTCFDQFPIGVQRKQYIGNGCSELVNAGKFNLRSPILEEVWAEYCCASYVLKNISHIVWKRCKFRDQLGFSVQDELC